MDNQELAGYEIKRRRSVAINEAEHAAEMALDDSMKAERVRELLLSRKKVVSEAEKIFAHIGMPVTDAGLLHFQDSRLIPLGKLPLPESETPAYGFACVVLQTNLDRPVRPFKTFKEAMTPKAVTLEQEREPRIVNRRCQIEFKSGDMNGENLKMIALKATPMVPDYFDDLDVTQSDFELSEVYKPGMHGQLEQLTDFLNEIDSLKPFVFGQDS